MATTAEYMKNIVRSWESLRIVYNAALLVEGPAGLGFLRLVGKHTGHAVPLYGASVWALIFLVGVFANLFYFLGPLVDALMWVVFKRKMGQARYFLFGVGLLFSMSMIFAMAMRMYTHLSGYLR